MSLVEDNFFVPPLWEEFFTENMEMIKNIISQIKKYGTFYPQEQDLFDAFNYCGPDEINVIIIGQDPYPGVIKGTNICRATGKSFSQHKRDRIAPSLSNIYSELERDISGFRRPDHGDLSEWALQGVLLLNKALSFCPDLEKSKSDRYKRLWEPFIINVIKEVIKYNKKCIFVMWGLDAQKVEKLIPVKAPCMLKCGHPSTLNRKGDFQGCGHFSMINKILTKLEKDTIDWRITSIRKDDSDSEEEEESSEEEKKSKKVKKHKKKHIKHKKDKKSKKGSDSD